MNIFIYHSSLLSRIYFKVNAISFQLYVKSAYMNNKQIPGSKSQL